MMFGPKPTQFHLGSPFFLPLKVKEEKRKKGLYIKETNNSLSILHLFTLSPSRPAFLPSFLCVCEGGGERRERWELGHAIAPYRSAYLGHVCDVLAHVATVAMRWPIAAIAQTMQRGATVVGGGTARVAVALTRVNLHERESYLRVDIHE